MTRSTVLGLALVGLVSLAAPAPALAQGDLLSVTFTTTPAGGPYAPRNIVAVWIEDAGGGFVKTIGRWAGVRKPHLVAWASASGQDADAVSGATRSMHGTLTATWDLADRAGVTVPDGTYTLRMELADSNATTTAPNHEGTFTFVKNGQSSTQTTTGGGFDAVTIDYEAGSASCNNGTIDPGETCDPPGSCPVSCAASADACMPNQLIGSPAGCTAECVVQPITSCIDGDGCCADGCDGTTDTDCTGGGPDDPVSGGCAAGGGSGGSGGGLAIAWLLVGLVVARRRRQAR